MPYIKKSNRDKYESVLSTLVADMSECAPGELNYLITTLTLAYIADQGRSYQTINDAIGVLECAKLELYRRLAAPYEDEKAKENGDVY